MQNKMFRKKNCNKSTQETQLATLKHWKHETVSSKGDIKIRPKTINHRKNRFLLY